MAASAVMVVDDDEAFFVASAAQHRAAAEAASDPTQRSLHGDLAEKFEGAAELLRSRYKSTPTSDRN